MSGYILTNRVPLQIKRTTVSFKPKITGEKRKTKQNLTINLPLRSNFIFGIEAIPKIVPT
jgi:hypothetical protein